MAVQCVRWSLWCGRVCIVSHHSYSRWCILCMHTWQPLASLLGIAWLPACAESMGSSGVRSAPSEGTTYAGVCNGSIGALLLVVWPWQCIAMLPWPSSYGKQSTQGTVGHAWRSLCCIGCAWLLLVQPSRGCCRRRRTPGVLAVDRFE